MKIIILQTSRKSLISHLYSYFTEIRKHDTHILEIKHVDDILKIAEAIKHKKVDRFVFSNGSDLIDQRLKKKILELNPTQQMLFSENAWLTWQDFLYLDLRGIGNKCSVFNTNLKKSNVKISNALNVFVKSRVASQLNQGTDIPYKGYVLVPLQVNNDSKLIIGSPHFKRVEEFVKYIVEVIPKDVKILFKNHPLNKHRIAVPKLPNVVDVTDSGYSKKSLINNSLFVAGINSTFLIESLYLKKPTISFGLDVFSNKGIVLDGFGKTYDELLAFKPNEENLKIFLDILISKQIPKKHILTAFKKVI